MKHLLFTIIFLLTLTFSAISQSPLPVGSSQLNAGVGLSSWGLPIYLGLDYSIHKDITIGGEFSFRSYDEKWRNNRYDHRIIGISGNGNYHFNSLMNIAQNWDFYAGLNLGFYSWDSPNNYEGNRSSGLGLGAQLGGRYYFTNNVGVNLELGSGNAFSNGKLGLTIKL